MTPSITSIARKISLTCTPKQGMRIGVLTCLVAGSIWSCAIAKADPSDIQTPPSAPADVDSKAPPRPKSIVVEARDRALEDLLRMSEFFDTTMPGTLKKYNLVFSISPRLADARRGEYIRLPVQLRYGLKERWEIYGGLTPFCPNPINSGKEHRWGPGEGRLGLRYDWGHWGKVFDDVTIGVENRTPLGKPPIDLIDYYTHVMPFINTSRPLPWKYTTLLISASYDRSFDSPDRPPAPEPPIVVRRHGFALTNGVLYKPGEFGGFVEYSWRHIEDQVLGTHLGHEFKVGPIWDIPLWRTQSWGLPGKWQIEFSERLTFEEGRDTSRGESLRVRWRSTFPEVFSKKSYQRKPRPPAE